MENLLGKRFINSSKYKNKKKNSDPQQAFLLDTANYNYTYIKFVRVKIVGVCA